MKRMRRVGAIVAAIAMLAMTGAATASAAEWTHEAEPLTENAAASFEGQLTFTGKTFSVSCWTSVETTLEPGGTGAVDVFDFSFPFGNCTTEGVLNGCSLTSTVMEAQELPWAFTPSSTSEIELGGVRLYNRWFGSCVPSPVERTFEGDLVAFPDSSENISSIAFKGVESGVLTASGGGEVTASGTLQASFGAEGAYGIQ